MSREELEKRLSQGHQAGQGGPNDARKSAEILKRAREAASRAVASRAENIEMTEVDEDAYSRLYSIVANEVRVFFRSLCHPQTRLVLIMRMSHTRLCSSMRPCRSRNSG